VRINLFFHPLTHRVALSLYYLQYLLGEKRKSAADLLGKKIKNTKIFLIHY
jgi:hypothetical protein